MLLSTRWRASARARIAAVGVVTAALGVTLTGVAHAEPPSNDDFDSATPVTALPFTARQDTAESTGSPDDPYWCQSWDITGGVWFRYTATEDGHLRATTAASDHWTILSANTGERGALQGVDNACDVGSAPTVTFPATAGTTYHFFVAGYGVPGGALAFDLDAVPPAPNDHFAAAEPVTTLPSTRQADLSTATFEADEPESSCVYDETEPSVWYSYTTEGPELSVTARVENDYSSVTVYSGSELTGLTEVGCALDSSAGPAVFRATPGTTYHLRVTKDHPDQRLVTLHLAEAPPLRPEISGWSPVPSVFDNVWFHARSWYAIDNPMTTQWDFGDGTTSPVGTEGVYHRYAADGVYPVTLRATSPDGRTATKTVDLTVETHDVGISRFAVPTSAREGETKSLTVHVTNTRYLETATVVLYKQDGWYWTEVGSLTLDVPARPNRTVRFPFAHTFTPDDARVGKVAFRAEVTLPYPVRDARLADNEVIAVATTVTAATHPVGAE